MNEDWNEEEDDQEVENDGKEMKRTYDAAVLRMQHCLSLCKAFPCTIFFSRIREREGKWEVPRSAYGCSRLEWLEQEWQRTTAGFS